MDIDIKEFSMKNAERSMNAFGQRLDPSGIAYMIIALTGELGEFANAYKKTVRKFNPGTGRDWETISRETLEAELADMFIYLDLLAQCTGVDLSEAVKKKFNTVSDNIGSPIKIK